MKLLLHDLCVARHVDRVRVVISGREVVHMTRSLGKIPSGFGAPGVAASPALDGL